MSALNGDITNNFLNLMRLSLALMLHHRLTTVSNAEVSDGKQGGGILCNQNTAFQCICQMGDRSYIREDYVKCGDLISSQNLSVVSIRLDVQQEWRAPLFHGEEYGLWFKKKLSNWVTKQCKSNANLCSGILLNIRRDNVVTLSVQPEADGTVTVDLVIIKDSRATTLSPDTTTSPVLVANVLRAKNITFSRLIGTGKIHEINIRIVKSTRFGSNDNWLKMTGTLIALIILGILLAIIYIVAIVKAIRDRRATIQRIKLREQAKLESARTAEDPTIQQNARMKQPLCEENNIIHHYPNYESMVEPAPTFEACKPVFEPCKPVLEPCKPVLEPSKPTFTYPKMPVRKAISIHSIERSAYTCEPSLLPKSLTTNFAPSSYQPPPKPPKPLTGTPYPTSVILGARQMKNPQQRIPTECSFASESSIHEDEEPMDTELSNQNAPFPLSSRPLLNDESERADESPDIRRRFLAKSLQSNMRPSRSIPITAIEKAIPMLTRRSRGGDSSTAETQTERQDNSIVYSQLEEIPEREPRGSKGGAGTSNVCIILPAYSEERLVLSSDEEETVQENSSSLSSSDGELGDSQDDIGQQLHSSNYRPLSDSSSSLNRL